MYLEGSLWLLGRGFSGDLLGALASDLGGELRITDVVESSGSPGDHNYSDIVKCLISLENRKYRKKKWKFKLREIRSHVY